MTNKPSAGPRAKTRNKFRSRGNLTVNKILKAFKDEQRVQIVVNGGFHQGMPHRRYHGLTGTVVHSRGSCYEVSVKPVGAKEGKVIIVHPVHLKAI